MKQTNEYHKTEPHSEVENKLGVTGGRGRPGAGCPKAASASTQ